MVRADQLGVIVTTVTSPRRDAGAARQGSLGSRHTDSRRKVIEMNAFRSLLAVSLLLLASGLAFAQPAASVSTTANLAATQTGAPTQPVEVAPAPDGRPDAAYDVIIYPILGWLPVMGIDFTLPDNPESDADSGLSGAAFVAFRWEFGRFAVSGDFNYAGASADRTSPTAEVELDLTSAGILGGFKIVNGLYIEGGARYRGLDVRASVEDSPEVTWEPSRWDPAIGFTFRPLLGSHWRLYSHIDWAGMGGDNLSSVYGIARIEWVPLEHLALTGGYAFTTMRATGEIGSEEIRLDYTLHGPVAGFGIPF
jgi:hypothetical protein